MHELACIATALFLATSLFAQEKAPGLTVVPSVDPEKYAGVWYEIARLPNPFQKDCVGEISATYTIDGDEFIVVNRCRKADGELSQAIGRARRADDNEPNSKLKVRFAPAFLSFLPFVWGNYWVIDLAPDYSYAVIGEPDREYLWILARTTTLPDSVNEHVLARIQKQGYDTGGLIYAKQF